MSRRDGIALLLAALVAGSRISADVVSTESGDPSTPTVIEVAPNLLVGATPDAAAMRRLYRRGFRVLVSVDGMRPEVELAARHGLLYVHVPIGYDGVPREAALALTRVAREAEGGVYVHCHHGKHRGPAAAAIVGRVLGEINDEAAVRRLLAAAGTDRRFTSLWSDAAAFRPPGPDVPLPELVAAADVEPLAAAMAAVDRAWDRIGEGEDQQAAALLLREALREAVRAGETMGETTGERPRDERMLAWLKQAEATALALEQAANAEAARAARETLGGQCVRCHARYRG